jgi:arsenate reductase-like glutaredoxin family protein
MRITITDVRESGHCVKGAKQWFEQYDLDFRAFLKDGISEEEFLATGDGFAEDIVKRLKERGQK